MIFIFSDAIYMTIVYLILPETNGKPLEEIDELFGDRVAETFEEASKRVEAVDDERADFFLPDIRGKYGSKIVTAEKQHAETV